MENMIQTQAVGQGAALQAANLQAQIAALEEQRKAIEVQAKIEAVQTADNMLTGAGITIVDLLKYLNEQGKLAAHKKAINLLFKGAAPATEDFVVAEYPEFKYSLFFGKSKKGRNQTYQEVKKFIAKNVQKNLVDRLTPQTKELFEKNPKMLEKLKAALAK